MSKNIECSNPKCASDVNTRKFIFAEQVYEHISLGDATGQVLTKNAAITCSVDCLIEILDLRYTDA